MNKNKLIVKNTLILYFRMFLTMGVSLYTSRIILKNLGFEDFGIYNIVGGIVVFFTFINNAMVTSTQRFLNYELGRNNNYEAERVFSTTVNIHIIISIIFFLLAETLGVFLLNNYINIPEEKIYSASIVFQLSIATTIINFIKAPYNAAVIAYEKMSVYAYISIIEVLCKLFIAYIITVCTNRLIAYSSLLTVVSFIIFISYYIYCKKYFTICNFSFKFDKEKSSEITSFSSWSLFGAFANMSADQGINVILNIFFGVTVNAAVGIANQVNSAIYQFVSNFQTAFNPQIIKSYAAKNKEYFLSIILNTSRYSYLLLFVLALPVIICCPSIMSLWLTNVPEHTVNFCRLIIIFSLIDALQGPLWVSAQATGKIKNYQLLMSSIILINIPLSYSVLLFFKIPELAIGVRILINLLTSFVRVIYLNKLYKFPIYIYIKDVIIKCILVTVFSFPIPTIIFYNINGVLGLVLSIISTITISLIVIYFVGLKDNEKIIIQNKIKKYI
ncbi:MAG: MATE family efflux transporter [Phocaeicola sp.]|nr:MATE family efflux transporter [Phocaeicola sp.]